MPPVDRAVFHYWGSEEAERPRKIRIGQLTSRTAMKGEHLFNNLRGSPFIQRVYRLGGEELVVLQASVEPALGDSFHQITDFNDLPTSLFACNVDQSVFEEQDGKLPQAPSEDQK
ncbi:hypothetical protein AALO_G00112130 [Alosa alosa]|uniref:Uncharacterized protein n=1 Tax=Alosa alosa TaxID=278164 RepID=A0AAV6GR93_9TELE|nr:hypothetical protein AALO_G00112130 [Alosa alosa]